MQLRFPRFNSIGTVDCEIEHPMFGWVPFTASPDDVEEHGRIIYEQALLMVPEPYVEPDPTPTMVPDVISRFQVRAALMDAGLLSDVETLISNADVIVQLAWAEAVEWRRDSPTIASIGAALELTEEDIDNLFIKAAGIVA